MSDSELRPNDLRRVIWWAIAEIGLAGISDHAPSALTPLRRPAVVHPGGVAIACPVVLGELRPLEEETAEDEGGYALLGDALLPGCAVLIKAPTSAITAFGSTSLLHAAVSGAQAVMTDGAMRDGDRIARLPIVAAACGRSPFSPAAHGYVRVRRPAVGDLFGSDWAEGDWLLLDSDGLAQLPSGAVRGLASSLAAEYEELSYLLGLESA